MCRNIRCDGFLRLWVETGPQVQYQRSVAMEESGSYFILGKSFFLGLEGSDLNSCLINHWTVDPWGNTWIFSVKRFNFLHAQFYWRKWLLGLSLWRIVCMWLCAIGLVINSLQSSGLNLFDTLWSVMNMAIRNHETEVSYRLTGLSQEM